MSYAILTDEGYVKSYYRGKVQYTWNPDDVAVINNPETAASVSIKLFDTDIYVQPFIKPSKAA